MSLPYWCCLDATEIELEADGLKNIARTECFSAKTQDDIPDRVSEAEVVAVWHTIWLDEKLLKRLKKARAIVRMGVGYDNVDIEAAGKLGIKVCNIPDYGTEEVADHAMSLILNLFRKTYVLAKKVDEGVVIQGADGIASAASGVSRIRGKVLGIVGLGRIGTATALRAKAFGFHIIYYDPYKPDGYDKAIGGLIRVDTLEELLTQSDCVSVHCNCIPGENEKMINAKSLAFLKKGAYIVNTARGEIIDETDLAAALETGLVGAAALDVHWGEPFVKGQGPLGQAPNLICTPHSAWFSTESRHEMRLKGIEAARRVIQGEVVRNVVNEKFLAVPPDASLSNGHDQKRIKRSA